NNNNNKTHNDTNIPNPRSANEILTYIAKQGFSNNGNNADESLQNNFLYHKYITIQTFIKESMMNIPNAVIFKQKLSALQENILTNVKMFRFLLPEELDLNLYFEMLNSRGENLEQHEIVKSLLMFIFNEDEQPTNEIEQEVINFWWNICSDFGKDINSVLTMLIKGDSNTTKKDKSNSFNKDYIELCKLMFREDFPKIKSEPCQKSTNNLQVVWEKLIQIYEKIMNKPKTEPDNSNPPTASKKKIIDIFNIFKNGDSNGQSNSQDSVSDRDKIHNYYTITDNIFSINFQNFLLHVLSLWNQRIFKDSQKITFNADTLYKQFADLFNLPNSNMNKNEEKVKIFIVYLIKSRIIMDHLMINNEEFLEEGMNLPLSGYNLKEKNVKNNPTIHKIVLILSMFHVSFPGNTDKYWFQIVLRWLFDKVVYDDIIGEEIKNHENYLKFLITLADAFLFLGTHLTELADILSKDNKSPSKFSFKNILYSQIMHKFESDENDKELNNLISECRVMLCDMLSEFYKNNNDHPLPIFHVFVYNYLDFKIWCEYHKSEELANPDLATELKQLKKDKKDKQHIQQIQRTEYINKFKFSSARRTIDHYYPRNPQNNPPESVNKRLNSFGNTSIVTHSLNSSMGNMPPEDKSNLIITKVDKRESLSLKLILMAFKFGESQKWTDEQVKEHEKVMIEILLCES
ncbi:MAG: HNH endonuclease family protein, partial [Bacteroidales bacterium]|nr:HNH endonuclease family protein [Bacteroidales bacterium]